MSNVQQKAREIFDCTSLHFEFKRVKIMNKKMNSLALVNNYSEEKIPITYPQIIENTLLLLTQELIFIQKIYAK